MNCSGELRLLHIPLLSPERGEEGRENRGGARAAGQIAPMPSQPSPVLREQGPGNQQVKLGAPASWVPHALAFDSGPEKLQFGKVTSEEGALTNCFLGLRAQKLPTPQPLWFSLPLPLGNRFNEVCLHGYICKRQALFLELVLILTLRATLFFCSS